MQKYLKAIKNTVCAVCVDSDDEGNCTLSKGELCAVEYFLPKIVDIVHSIDSGKMEEYSNLLHEKICSECNANSEEGNCYLREDSNCSLDRYFSLIVQTIQNVDKGIA